jgi:hypothetical protein
MLLLQKRTAMLLLLACKLSIPSEHTDYKYLFLKLKLRRSRFPTFFFFEGSNQLTNLCLQHNGFELTCGAVSMRARFTHDIELPLIYEMHFQTADCLDKRARACRAGRLSELLGRICPVE